jgi:hypothetical protein
VGFGALVYSGRIATVQPAVARNITAAKRTAQRDLGDLLILVLPFKGTSMDLAYV